MSIKLAALDCFLTSGYEATTITRIRERSGASTGSIYHFFSGKPAFAAELFEEAIAGWQAATGNVYDPDSPRSRLTAPTYGLVEWGLQDPQQFRFFNEVRSLLPVHAELAECGRILNVHLAGIERTVRELTDEGFVRALPWPVTQALLLGPALHFLGTVTSHRRIDPADSFAPATFAEAAWDHLRLD